MIDAVSVRELKKSIYFSIYPSDNYPTELQQAWFYVNGVFPGEFEYEVGRGAEGIVLKGAWYGQDAAFKFVEIQKQEFKEKVADGLKDLNKRLTEVNALKSIQGSRILFHHGIFR